MPSAVWWVRRAWGRAASEATVRVLGARSGIDLGAGVRFRGVPLVSLAEGSTIVLGDRTEIVSASTSAVLGVSHRTALRTLLHGARIEFGADVGMSGGTVCAARRVVIGDGTLLGADVTITDTDFHPLRSGARRYADLPAPREQDEVHIGRNVFLGTRAIVLKGVAIGDNTVVGAGSVVARSLPPNTVCAGSPASVLTTFEPC